MNARVKLAAIDKLSKTLDKVKGKFPELSRAVSRTNTAFSIMNKTTEKFRKSAEKVGKSITSVGKGMSLAFTAPVVGAIGFSLKKFIDFQEALQEVQGSTRLSGDELKVFGDRIMAATRTMPVSSTELLALADIAGQNGVRGVDNLNKFAVTMAQLGKTTKINAEEATDAITKILDLTGEGAGNVDKFGAAFVTAAKKFGIEGDAMLDNTFAITKEISKFGVSSSQILGLVGSIEPLGFASKQAASAVGEAFRGIDDSIRMGGQRMQGLQAITGMTAAELKEQFGKDSTVVFKKFLDGLNKIRASGGPTAKALAFFGASGDKTQIILEALGKDTGKLEEAMKSMSAAYAENTALSTEYASQTDNLKSKIAIFTNRIEILSKKLGEQLAPYLEKAIALGICMIDWLEEHPTAAKWIAIFAGIMAVVGPLLIGLGFFVSTILPGLITAFSIVTSVMAGFKIVLSGIAVVTGLLTLKFIIIAAVILGLVYLIWKFRDAIANGLLAAWDWVTDKISMFIEKTKGAIDVIKTFLGFTGKSVDLNMNSESTNKIAPQGAPLGGLEAQSRANPEFSSQTNNARVDINVRAPQSTMIKSESEGGFLSINRGLAGAF